MQKKINLTIAIFYTIFLKVEMGKSFCNYNIFEKKLSDTIGRLQIHLEHHKFFLKEVLGEINKLSF